MLATASSRFRNASWTLWAVVLAPFFIISTTPLNLNAILSQLPILPLPYYVDTPVLKDLAVRCPQSTAFPLPLLLLLLPIQFLRPRCCFRRPPFDSHSQM